MYINVQENKQFITRGELAKRLCTRISNTMEKAAVSISSVSSSPPETDPFAHPPHHFPETEKNVARAPRVAYPEEGLAARHYHR